jgi:hypothetical protein
LAHPEAPDGSAHPSGIMLSELMTPGLLAIEVPTWNRAVVGWPSMANNRRMPREKATTALSTLLETICAGALRR